MTDNILNDVEHTQPDEDKRTPWQKYCDLPPVPGYMMAMEATHQTGPLKKLDDEDNEPELCHVTRTVLDEYVGQFIEGMGFMGVRFPVKTTRRLTEEEFNKYHGRTMSINGGIGWTLDLLA